MRIIGNNPQLSRQTQATASGAITGGLPVIVNTDGTVTQISETTEALGTAVVYETGNSPYGSSTFDSNSNRVVAVYRDNGNSNYGTVAVGTVNASDNSISFGTPVVFVSASTGTVDIKATFDSNSNKVVIVWSDSSDSVKGKAIVGTVDSSDNSISFGSATEFEAGGTYNINVTFDSNSNKVVIIYKDAGNSYYFTSIVGTVSGTSISFGTAVVIVSSNYSYFAITFDSSNNKVVAALRGASNHGQSYVGTVSGTSISWGTVATFHTSAQPRYIGATFDSNSNKVVFSYMAGGEGNDGFAVVGTVSGTDITFGTPVEFENADVSYTSASFNSNVNKVIISYRDEGNSNYGTYIIGTVSSTSISFGSAAVFETAGTDYTFALFDSSANRSVITYRGASQEGKAIVLRPAVATNITSENFIGFAQDTVATGQPVTVNTKGAIADNIPQVPSSAAVGTKVEFVAADTSQSAPAVFDPDTNKVIIAFSDEGNSSYGTVVVATIDSSDNSVTYGSKVVFNSAQTSNSVMVYDTNSDRIVIGYATNFSSLTGTAIVGTVSGSSVSFGSAVGFSGKTSKLAATFDSNSNKVVFGYEDHANSEHGTAIVGTVDPSDNSISFGSEAVYKSAETSGVGMCFDTNSNKVVIAYRHDADSNKGEAIVGTVSGTSISYGSATVFNASNTQQFDRAVVFDSSNNKVVIVYHDDGASNNLEAQVGTVSGTSISFGTLATLPDSSDGSQAAAVFDSDNNNIIIAYQDDGEHGNIVIGTVSGTDISFNTPVEFESGDYVGPKAVAYDTNTKRALIAFQDYAASGHGQGIVFSPAGDVDLTPAQTYFVQTDGTLSETADSPSVTAGTAVAGSTLIVKG